jgi:hypothetical protein
MYNMHYMATQKPTGDIPPSASENTPNGKKEFQDVSMGRAREHAKIRTMLNPEAIPESIVEQGIKFALSEIDRKYPTLPLHNRQHTETIIRRITALLTKLQSQEGVIGIRHVGLGKIAAAFHDIERDLKAPQNEEESAKQALVWMKSCNTEDAEMFTEEDMSLVRDAIMATVPAFPGGKFEQPNLFPSADAADHLSPASRLIATSLALSDVVTPADEGFTAYRQEGKKRFREWPDGKMIQTTLLRLHKRSDLDEQTEKIFKEKMCDWLKRQTEFAKDMHYRYIARVLDLADAQYREPIRDVFAGLDDIVAQSEACAVAAAADDKNMWVLAEEMGLKSSAA